MKLITPKFFGEIADGCEIKRDGFLIRHIKKLIINIKGVPENDIVTLPGVCCMATEEGKNALINVGLSAKYFHLVEISPNKQDKLYFIDVDAKGSGIEIYRGTNIKVEDEKYETLKSLINIKQSKVKQVV